jgi:hypothetical protein
MSAFQKASTTVLPPLISAFLVTVPPSPGVGVRVALAERVERHGRPDPAAGEEARARLAHVLVPAFRLSLRRGGDRRQGRGDERERQSTHGITSMKCFI